MEKFFKFLVTVFIIGIAISLIVGAFKALSGNYVQNASFITSVMLFVGLLAALAICFLAIKHLWKIGVLFFIVLQSCSYAKSNQQVVVSSDCGMSWKAVNVGDAVPTGTGNRCFMKVVMPNFPMQGQTKFIGNFKDKVRATIELDYDYSITEPLAFIRQAKYLGSANTDADSKEALNASVFETAENSVIDKRLREVVKGVLVNEDIVEADQAELENSIHDKTNAILKSLGVQLNFITLTFDLDEQTRQAIDVATASKIYQVKGLEETGKLVMSARAGATKVSVTTRNELLKEQD